MLLSHAKAGLQRPGTELRHASAGLGAPAADPGGDARYVADFTDEAGNRTSVDQAFLSCVLGVAAPEGATESAWPEVVLWRGLAAKRARAWALERVEPGNGALFASAADRLGLEAWTRCELAGLHALAAWRGDERVRRRVEDATTWLMREIQPDNATNEPWGVWVFAARWVERGDAEARLYAETMVHNAVVARGRPDRRSGWILLDAARRLSRG